MSELPIITVTELTLLLKETLEMQFPLVAVLGEISNLKRAASGHAYFTLKDSESQVNAILWRNAYSRLKFELTDGLEVVALGRLEVYVPRGNYQIIVEQIMPQGVGPLELAYQQLKDKLAAEGLFDLERKRPLPQFPRKIAVITSPTGAAVRDIIQVLHRRWPMVEIVLLPVQVQGESASRQIAQALLDVARIPEIDVVIAGRGGGSLEDLWAFNEEIVARAIAACPIPVISAVGHEIDFTIADFVADRRGATPTEAAELAVPDQLEIRGALRGVESRMRTALRERTIQTRRKLDELSQRRVFTRPADRLADLTHQLDEIAERMSRAQQYVVQTAKQQLASMATALSALSPLNVLDRGYTITRRATSEEELPEVITDLSQLQPGEEIVTDFSIGRIISRVEKIDPSYQVFQDHKPS